RRTASGAGHDAMVIGEFIPSAMIFVPSRGGISHSSDEFTEPGHCVDGGRGLLRALLELDELLDPAASLPRLVGGVPGAAGGRGLRREGHADIEAQIGN